MSPNTVTKSLSFPCGDPSTVQAALGVTTSGGGALAAIGSAVAPVAITLALGAVAIWGIYKIATRDTH